MSGKLAPIDFVITIGAFILTLGLYKMVKPVLFSYAATRLVSDEIGSSGEFTVEQCAQTESKECCKLAEQEGMVTEESMTNCHLCHHPDCTGVVAQQDDPAISLPFKKNIASIIRPKGRELYDYVNQYARAYATDEPDVVPEWYPPIKPTPPELSHNEIRAQGFTKKYGCRKVKDRNGKWQNICYGLVNPDEEDIRLAPPDNPIDQVGQFIEERPTSTYARAYAGRVTYV